MSDHKEINVEKYDKNMQINKVENRRMKWIDAKEEPFDIRGFAWFAEEKKFRRLPISPKEKIPEAVDHLANCTAGGQIRFQTNSTKLSIRVKLSGKANMPHMTAIGQCGFDCYIGEFGEERYLSSTYYAHEKDHYEIELYRQKNRENQVVTLYFPLYQGVETVSIGIDPKARVLPPPPYQNQKKVIFYGTSITQGGCATRPGLAYTNILSRRINQEIINLGFSGSGKGEISMARLIQTIQSPACLVLDYEPNCVSTKQYKKTLPAFIATYREKHPEVPILVISKFPYAKEQLDQNLYKERIERLEFQKNLIYHLQEEGDRQLYFFDGATLLGDHFYECTVDGVHPNDLGFMKMADRLTPLLQKILQKTNI